MLLEMAMISNGLYPLARDPCRDWEDWIVCLQVLVMRITDAIEVL